MGADRGGRSGDEGIEGREDAAGRRGSLETTETTTFRWTVTRAPDLRSLADGIGKERGRVPIEGGVGEGGCGGVAAGGGGGGGVLRVQMRCSCGLTVVVEEEGRRGEGAEGGGGGWQGGRGGRLGERVLWAEGRIWVIIFLMYNAIIILI
jgi:hypothetical protein